MAAGRWEEIRFARVASLCLQRHRKAFLNEALKGVLTPAQDVTGNRHPDDPARVAARLHLREAIVSKKGVQGKALMPHEIVQPHALDRLELRPEQLLIVNCPGQVSAAAITFGIRR